MGIFALGRFCRPGLIVNIRMNVAGNEDYNCKICHQKEVDWDIERLKKQIM